MLKKIVMLLYAPCKHSCLAVTLVILPLLIAGCASVRTPAELHYMDGAIIESLSSNASLSYTTPDRSDSGSGVLMFRKPDQLRMIILSPFGSVLQEIFVTGQNVTIIDTGNGIAFSGTVQELPKTGNFAGWQYVHWLIDMDPPSSSYGTKSVERVNRFGDSERAVFENGLVVSKSIADVGCVKYSNYTALQGIAVPHEITYEAVTGERLVIKLEEPEINLPVSDAIFTPKLNTLRVYPLSILK
ncbi:MAG: lipoprotein insertase outer membrane protein LolB [Desulfuromonadaceae bacterium]|nr:lipoprotein insertase outer membrane protein LolB [Desulfuromonadaceae bacterium]MDD5106778.1 lipoprotein insertase outer membrane protein LolB [Desulfuromonadaceae bacterium]